MDERPVAYGYLRVPDHIPDDRARDLDLALRDVADESGFRLAGTLVEPVDGAFTVLEELISELRRTTTRLVVVPSLDHLGTHPALRMAVLDRLRRTTGATVIVADIPPIGRWALLPTAESTDAHLRRWLRSCVRS